MNIYLSQRSAATDLKEGGISHKAVTHPAAVWRRIWKVDREKLHSLISGVHDSKQAHVPNTTFSTQVVNETSLCGRYGRMICGPLCVPKSTYVTLAP